MNRRQFVRSSIAGLAVSPVASRAVPPAKEMPALVFRQKAPQSSRFFYVQFLRDAAPRSFMGRLFNLKPEFVNPQLGLLAIATDGATESGEGRGTVLRSKDVHVYQPKGKFIDLNRLISCHMGEMPLTIPPRVSCRKVTYQKNSCRVWNDGDDNTAEASQFLLADKPFRWNWALLLVENGRINLHFAEKLKIVDEAKGSLQIIGAVITFGFEGIQMVELAQVELPKESLLLDLDEKHDLTHLQRCDRAEMMAEIRKTTALND